MANGKVVPPFVRSPYNYDVAAVSNETGLMCRDESLTQQSFAEDADINVIMKRFGITGQIPEGVRMPVYGDFTGIGDFRQALEAMAMARDSFMAMPADVRSEFKNDPHLFVEFCKDPANQKRAGELGLLRPDVWERVQRDLRAEEAARQAEFQKRVDAAVAARMAPSAPGDAPAPEAKA